MGCSVCLVLHTVIASYIMILGGLDFLKSRIFWGDLKFEEESGGTLPFWGDLA